MKPAPDPEPIATCGPRSRRAAVVGRRVGVRVAAAGDLADVLAPREPEVRRGRGERACRSRRGRRRARRAVEPPRASRMSAGRRYGLSAGRLARGVVKTQVRGRSAAARSTASSTRRGRRLVGAGLVRRRRAGRALGERRATGGRSSGARPGRRLAVLLDLRAAAPRGGRGRPRARPRSAAWAVSHSSGRRRAAAGSAAAAAAALGQVRLGARRAGLGAVDAAGQALGAGRGLLARSASAASRRPARRLDLAAEVLHAGELALERAPRGRRCRARCLLGLAQPGQQRRARDLARASRNFSHDPKTSMTSSGCGQSSRLAASPARAATSPVRTIQR